MAKDLLIELQENICKDWLNFSDTSVGMSIPRLTAEEIANELSSEDWEDSDIQVIACSLKGFSDAPFVLFKCEGRTFILYQDGDEVNGNYWDIKEKFTDYNEKGLNI
jgi:hypothetical protein